MREWFDSLVVDTVTVAHGGTMRALMVALPLDSLFDESRARR
jgi:probable phosphoglycerate mutase